MKTLKVLKVIVQPVLVEVDEDGELREHVADPLTLSRSGLRDFADTGLDEAVADVEAKLNAESAEELTEDEDAVSVVTPKEDPPER